ncbi:MAG: S46 family peptidase [Polyangia bacterium]
MDGGRARRALPFLGRAPRALLAGVALGGLLAGAAATGRADEGMWPVHSPPRAAWQKDYGFAPGEDFLLHLQRAAVKLSDGGSASFVSGDGLLLTNHHVARSQIHKLSTPSRDLLRDGFYARSRADELRCPDLEARVLWSYEDVTERVRAALAGPGSGPGKAAADASSPSELNRRRKAALAAIEEESLKQTGLRSEVVTLYGGGQYMLYRYRRYSDVRLVFAPEEQAAAFGGEYDNFTYPRHALDFAVLRVYDDGKPLRPSDHLRLAERPAKDGELVLVAGHPGTTSRLLTVAQLTHHRDELNPVQLAILAARRAALVRFGATSPEAHRRMLGVLRSIDNSLKRLTFQQAGLKSPAGFARKQREEAELRAEVQKRPALRSEIGDPWGQIAAAYRGAAGLSRRHQYTTLSHSKLAMLALHLLRYPRELAKPNGERLEDYRESRLESLRLQLTSPAPLYPDLEEAVLADWLAQVKAALGDGDPFVKAALGGRPPEVVARELVAGTKLLEVAPRQALLDGGAQAVEQSTDPLLAFVRRVDAPLRELRNTWERRVHSVENLMQERIARARFAVYGDKVYPDATSTLRLGYGRVQGYLKDTRLVPYQTLLYGLFDRALSFGEAAPYQLAPRLQAARVRLDPTTPLNFVYTADTIGGNSGSPVVSRDGALVGLNFDSNLEKLGNRYFYVPDDEGSRAVAVESVAILHALRTAYDAAELAAELLGTAPSAATWPAGPATAPAVTSTPTPAPAPARKNP